MAERPLSLEDLRELATFLRGLSDEDLKESAVPLILKKFPEFSNRKHVLDIAWLVKAELRYRKK